mgnify:CR=1 FL=1
MAVMKLTAKPELKPEQKSEPKPSPTPVTVPTTVWAGNVPQIRQGTYSDGLPFNEVKYLCCKLILKPNRFTSRKSLFDFGDVLKGPAKKLGVTWTMKGFQDIPIKIREVETMTGPNTKTIESFGVPPKGTDEMKMMRIELTRE